MRHVLLVAVYSLLATAALRADAPKKLVVHEWGTFTVLQDESGNSLGGINTDDEPLPPFVHDVAANRLIQGQFSNDGAKGLPFRGLHPRITMRLETPVTYFHLPEGVSEMTVDVEVKFKGGWLTQFFPLAEAEAPGLDLRADRFELSPETVGTLKWRGLRIGGSGSYAGVGPTTDLRVWLAPREVDSAPLTTADGKESEQYLFYRGVGDVPIGVKASRRGELAIWDRGRVVIGEPWFVEVRGERLAYRRITMWTDNTAAQRHRGVDPGVFNDGDFSARALLDLRHEMHEALIAGGLFPDEADAMLATWHASYFKMPGQRVFFLVDQRWTDRVLPLTISVPAEVKRVMVGRIELVTPEQRAAAERLAQTGKASDALAIGGRFRDAIALDQQRRTPTEPIDAFMRKHVPIYRPRPEAEK